ncbi:MAG: hypothetical protein WD016_04815 [Balneolaceae bacterium]
MRRRQILSFVVVLILSTQIDAFGSTNNENDKLKKYINDVVQKVEEAENAEEKRALLNTSFDKLITTFEKVEKMKGFSEEEIAQIGVLKSVITDRKDELNGDNGFAKVENNQLNNYANFVQQNMEQAQNYITISAGLAVVIVLLLLLL